MIYFEPRWWRGVLDATLCDKVCEWLATGQWFSPVSSFIKTDHHDITEILLKVALNTINQSTIYIIQHISPMLKPTFMMSNWWNFVEVLCVNYMFPLFLDVNISTYRTQYTNQSRNA
jgi:hypothetical protein